MVPHAVCKYNENVNHENDNHPLYVSDTVRIYINMWTKNLN